MVSSSVGPSGLHANPANTARQPRSRFLFQDQCVALRCAESLVPSASALRAVVVEWSSDHLAITADGSVEVVSIKHREAGPVPWSVDELDRAVRDLHRYWRAMGGRCRCVLASNRAVHTRQRERFARDWPAASGLPADEAARFLRDLVLDAKPLPDRRALPAVGVDVMRGALERLDRDPRFAPQCWQALVDAVARVAVEQPPTSALRASRLAGARRRAGAAHRLTDQTLRLADLRALVGRVHDSLSHTPVAPVPVPGRAPRPAARTGWAPGVEVAVGTGRYRLSAPIDRTEAPDGSVAKLAVQARQLVPVARDVRLRVVQVERNTQAARQALAAAGNEAELLDELAGVAGLPRLADCVDDIRGLVLVTIPPVGRSVADRYGDPRVGTYSPVVLDALLRGLPRLATALGALHERGYAHRELSPTTLVADGAGLVPRDVGLATTPAAVGEGPAGYRAPEQRRPLITPVGAHTDVFGVGALVYHAATGRLPGNPLVPASVLRPGLSVEFSAVLERALHPDPTSRPTLRRCCARLARLAGHTVARGESRRGRR